MTSVTSWLRRMLDHFTCEVVAPENHHLVDPVYHSTDPHRKGCNPADLMMAGTMVEATIGSSPRAACTKRRIWPSAGVASTVTRYCRARYI